jgi:hypothetical protein
VTSDSPEPDPALADLAGRLHGGRPQPEERFRHRLGAHLSALASAQTRPAHLGLKIAAYAVSGSTLLAVAAAITFL